MYNCPVIINVNLFFKWQKLNLKLHLLFKKNQMYLVQVFMLKLKHLALNQVNFIKRPTEGKVNKMAQSEKKRIEGKKPVSRKSQIKFEKRIKNNHEVINKLQ